SLFFCGVVPYRDLHYFPTRRSSDLGIIKLEDQISILLDFEKIVVEINPATGLNLERLEVLGPRERSEKKIVVAEDSPMLRELLKDRKSTRLNSSHVSISYAVFCLKK